jgi:hypothetical protein
MTLGCEDFSLTRTNGGADVFSLAGFSVMTTDRT